MKTKKQYAYGIQAPPNSSLNGKPNNGFVYPFSIQHLRKDATRNFVIDYGRDWKHWQKHGFKCVKVEIKIVKKKKK